MKKKPVPRKREPMDEIRVERVFVGEKTAREAFCDAAVKKIMYDTKRNP